MSDEYCSQLNRSDEDVNQQDVSDEGISHRDEVESSFTAGSTGNNTTLERSADQSNDDESNTEKALFSPPLYIQRYQKICELVVKYEIKSILDLGCGECRLITRLKNLEHLERISGLDIDRAVLTMARMKCRPWASDYLQPRERPLSVQLYHGDITILDSRILSHEMIVLVEVVEHLFEDELAKLPEVVFGAMKPKYCVVTTPNADYNVLFNNFNGLRHFDHKFEWSRTEFRQWAEEICMKYDYKVEFDGVGSSPEDRDVGFCTQIAIFERMNEFHAEPECDDQHELICCEKYPYRTEERKVRDAVCRELERVLPDLVEDDVRNMICLDVVYEKSDLNQICERKALAGILRSVGYCVSNDDITLVIDRRHRSGYSSFSSEDSGGQFSDAEDDESWAISFDSWTNSETEVWD